MHLAQLLERVCPAYAHFSNSHIVETEDNSFLARGLHTMMGRDNRIRIALYGSYSLLLSGLLAIILWVPRNWQGLAFVIWAISLVLYVIVTWRRVWFE